MALTHIYRYLNRGNQENGLQNNPNNDILITLLTPPGTNADKFKQSYFVF